jgi:pyruvate,water dikinase
MYGRFREILAGNDAILQFIAELDDQMARRAPLAIGRTMRQVRAAEMQAFVIVKNLNLLSGNAHAGLYATLSRLGAEIDRLDPSARDTSAMPMFIPMAEVRLEHAPHVGAKLARLGHARAAAAVRVPDGFVVTVAAFEAFMSENGLWERAGRLDDLAGRRSKEAHLAAACDEVQRAASRAPVPAAVAAGLLEAFDRLAAHAGARVAVRSSAIGEDTRASHAGQYRTVLRVDREGLLDAYRAVLASTYSCPAVAYRFEHQFGAAAPLMAVGVLDMITPRCSGVLFSRRPEAPTEDAIVVAAVPGLAAGLAAGEADAALEVIEPGRARSGLSLTTDADVDALWRTARSLEACFGGPQEIEWAIDGSPGVVVLQSRALVTSAAASGDRVEPLTAAVPLLTGGLTACPGVGAGPVVRVLRDEDLDGFPEGGVLLARQASVGYSRVLSRAAAIVTDVGSPASHLASLAREYGVPALVGCPEAMQTLVPGDRVTVDATGHAVYAGILPARRAPRARVAEDTSPARITLERIARLVTPLSLTDSTSPEFTPERCRSLHDVTRFVHEMAYEVVFEWADVRWDRTSHARRLDVRLPLEVHVIDVGGGLRGPERDAAGAGADETDQPAPPQGDIAVADVLSVPFRALLAGMLDQRLRTDRPKPPSARGFLAVVGERMAGLPGESLEVGGASYAIVSDRYLNFATKAGYHFATVDTYCGRSLNKNYIHFRFAGGAADPTRRARRVQFIRHVLEPLEFRVQTRGDILVARLEKHGADTLTARLRDLGRLVICARQLDMLMDSEGSPASFGRAFLAGEIDRF